MKKAVLAKGLAIFSGMLFAAVLLLAFAPTAQAYAENQEAQVRYEVSATVTFIDGENETVQKVPAGTILKEPQPKGSKGCTFIGWMNRETGAFWNFTTPVDASLTLVACYEAERTACNEKDSGGMDWTERVPLVNESDACEPRSLQKTGDHAPWPFALAVALLALLAAAYAAKERFRR